MCMQAGGPWVPLDGGGPLAALPILLFDLNGEKNHCIAEMLLNSLSSGVLGSRFAYSHCVENLLHNREHHATFFGLPKQL